MATIVDRVDLDRISAEAREVHIGRAVLTVIAAFLYILGWIAAKTCMVIWFAAAWSFTAVRLGWQDARREAVKGRVGAP